MSEKVVPFQPKQSTQREDELVVIGLDGKPRELTEEEREKLAVINEAVLEDQRHINSLVEKIVEVTDKYANENENNLDVSIPLMALTNAIMQYSSIFDKRVDPALLQNHYDIRTGLMNKFAKVLEEEITAATGDNEVFTQDIYFSVGMLLSSEITQTRVHQLYTIAQEEQKSE